MQRSISGTVNSAAVNHDEVNAAEINALEQMAASLDAADPALEVVNELVCFLKSPNEFVSVENDAGPATGASEFLVRLEPNERFERLVAALRTLNRDLLVVENTSHSGPPESCENARLAGTGEGSQ